ncbi:hypothetical protein SP99_04572 [Enterobacter sp. BIDMC92]|uniref:ATP-binding protein n=1 Tax=Enterobacter sp. BIDMC92 TaxID=1594172 RepID=UPI00064D3484|nr:ATP-binding protein [Enterobacter sp. BIDMC92]KLW85410.1 hypothetical protein SP99_04572 [Enterobacter sp. BIDMC92]
MAGIKKRMKTSVQLRLSLVLGIAILLTAIISGGITFYLAQDEARELQDDTLRQIAYFTKSHDYNALPEKKGQNRADDDSDAKILVEYLTVADTQKQGLGITFPLPTPVREGFQNVTINNVQYRVLVHRLTKERFVIVGQQTEVRDEIASASALRTMIPFILLLPLLLLVTTELIKKSFRPVLYLAAGIYRRDERDLTPLVDDNIPDEIRPFVEGINRLLLKVDNAIQEQKRFIADAAHELRTPLTALSLQAERLSASDMSAEARGRLAALRLGLTREKKLLEQLLSLAREQQLLQTRGTEAVSLIELFRQVIETLLPLALKKRIDIGVVETTCPAGSKVFTEKYSLYTALKNLVENAIHYIPENGQIDLRLQFIDNCAVIDVEDNGPGIAAEQRERVFDAFYRPAGTEKPGSGLGLSIVKACVRRLGGTITLAPSSHFPSGLLARITLPVKNHSG